MIVTKPRWLICAGVLCFASIFASRAEAVEVYPGCAIPPTAFKHIWYIDPVNGKTAAEGGLGTSGRPVEFASGRIFRPARLYRSASHDRAVPASERRPSPPMCSPLGRRPARSNLATKSCS